jgi:ferritin
MPDQNATIQSKTLMLLEQQMKLEALAAKKSALYAGYFQDAVLKGYSQQLALHHRDNLASLSGYLDGLK